LPVFFSLFYMLRKDLKARHLPGIVRYGGRARDERDDVACDQVDPGSAKFLFIPDLTAHATGGVLAVLLVLYVGSQLLSSVLMSVTADRNQRFIMIALPFVFVPFIQGFPAGLLVYWITTNFWTVGQQYVIRRGAGLPVLGAPGSGPVTSGAAAAVPDKGGGAPKTKEPKATKDPKAKPKPSANGDDGAPAEQRERRASAPPPPPRQRRKKKTEGADDSDVVREHGFQEFEEVSRALG
jgi:YidC/Oxa1 family membrane protein insertase